MFEVPSLKLKPLLNEREEDGWELEDLNPLVTPDGDVVCLVVFSRDVKELRPPQGARPFQPKCPYCGSTANPVMAVEFGGSRKHCSDCGRLLE